MEQVKNNEKLIAAYDRVIPSLVCNLTTAYRDTFFGDILYREVYNKDATHEYTSVHTMPHNDICMLERTVDGGYPSVGQRIDVFRKSNQLTDEIGGDESDYVDKSGTSIFPFFENCQSMGIQRYPIVSYSLRVGALLSDEFLMLVISEDSTDSVPQISFIQMYSDHDIDLNAVNEFLKTKQVKYNPQKEFLENQYSVVVYSPQRGLFTQSCTFRKWQSDVAKNYNDDLPYAKMQDILTRDTSELIMLHGKPGTGKSSIIKTLINDVGCKKRIEFLYFPTDIFEHVTSSDLIYFFSQHQHSVCVLEDCEKLLLSRDISNNGLSLLLNMTDGVLGEALSLKFICTFNTLDKNIDSALLRKGRLSLKYEFKELCLEKSKAINPAATKPMILADLYNTESNIEGPSERKIGF